MKFGAKPRKIWNQPSELNGKYNRLSNKLNRLMVLDHVWNKLVADKEKFWKLIAVKGSILYVFDVYFFILSKFFLAFYEKIVDFFLQIVYYNQALCVEAQYGTGL